MYVVLMLNAQKQTRPDFYFKYLHLRRIFGKTLTSHMQRAELFLV